MAEAWIFQKMMPCQKYWVFTCPLRHYQWDNNYTVQSSQKKQVLLMTVGFNAFQYMTLDFFVGTAHIWTLSAMLTFGSCVCVSCLTMSYISYIQSEIQVDSYHNPIASFDESMQGQKETHIIIVVAHHCSYHTKVFWPSSKPPVHKCYQQSKVHLWLFAYKFNPYKNGKTWSSVSSVCLFNMM